MIKRHNFPPQGASFFIFIPSLRIRIPHGCPSRAQIVMKRSFSLSFSPGSSELHPSICSFLAVSASPNMTALFRRSARLLRRSGSPAVGSASLKVFWSLLELNYEGFGHGEVVSGLQAFSTVRFEGWVGVFLFGFVCGLRLRGIRT